MCLLTVTTMLFSGTGLINEKPPITVAQKFLLQSGKWKPLWDTTNN